MKTHDIHGHTSEVSFTAFGQTLEEAFEHCGVALFDIMAEITDVETTETTSFTCEANDRESLLYDFLDQLIYLRDTEYLIYMAFDVTIKQEDDAVTLEAQAHGCPMDEITTTLDVKAVTYSDMVIEQEDVWQLTVTLDV